MPDRRPIDVLNERLNRETRVYRKGAEATVKQVGPITVYEVFGYPETPSAGQLVDVHFVTVGFTEAAADPDGFRDDLAAACDSPGEFQHLSMEQLQQGPSYITLGSWLGSQDQALRLLALGVHYRVWDHVVTPERLHMPEDKWDHFAGMGYVMPAPFGWVVDPRHTAGSALRHTSESDV